MNRSKARGTAAETAVVRWFRANGFGAADRQPLRGNRDAGDIALTVGVVVEVKSYAGTASLGQPAGAQLASWMGQAEAERANAGALYCPLVVKRSGTADVGRWWAFVTAGAVLALMRGELVLPDPSAPICMSVGSLAALLRAAGHGDEMEEVVA